MNYKFSEEDKLCAFILNRAICFSPNIKTILVKNNNNNICRYLTERYIELVRNLKPDLKIKNVKKIKKRKSKKQLYWIPSLNENVKYGNIFQNITFQQAYYLSKYFISNNLVKENE